MLSENVYRERENISLVVNMRRTEWRIKYQVELWAATTDPEQDIPALLHQVQPDVCQRAPQMQSCHTCTPGMPCMDHKHGALQIKV